MGRLYSLPFLFLLNLELRYGNIIVEEIFCEVNMDIKAILSTVDHTYLKQDATWAEIKRTCDEGIKYKTASVCIPPSFVKSAKEYVGGELKICTVTGFPNGYSTVRTKCFESQEAVLNGADEIDTVINIGDLKSENYQKVLGDLKDIKAACEGKILKVIIETCLLTEYEKQKMCSGLHAEKTQKEYNRLSAHRQRLSCTPLYSQE